MGNQRWPAMAFQSIFLVMNSAYLMAGKTNWAILLSVTLLLFLFVIQIVSDRPRFLYLFPVHLPTQTKTPSRDTLLLKAMIVASVVFFYIGALGPKRLLSYIGAVAIVACAILFPKAWYKWWEEKTQEIVRAKIQDNISQQASASDNERP